MSENKKSTGLSLTTVLFLVFLILKLTNNIDWSWWWVTSPIWLPFALVICIGLLFLTIFVLILIFGGDLDKLKSILDKLNKK
jgi:hypothetical protein